MVREHPWPVFFTETVADFQRIFGIYNAMIHRRAGWQRGDLIGLLSRSSSDEEDNLLVQVFERVVFHCPDELFSMLHDNDVWYCVEGRCRSLLKVFRAAVHFMKCYICRLELFIIEICEVFELLDYLRKNPNLKESFTSRISSRGAGEFFTGDVADLIYEITAFHGPIDYGEERFSIDFFADDLRVLDATPQKLVQMLSHGFSLLRRGITLGIHDQLDAGWNREVICKHQMKRGLQEARKSLSELKFLEFWIGTGHIFSSMVHPNAHEMNWKTSFYKTLQNTQDAIRLLHHGDVGLFVQRLSMVDLQERDGRRHINSLLQWCKASAMEYEEIMKDVPEAHDFYLAYSQEMFGEIDLDKLHIEDTRPLMMSIRLLIPDQVFKLFDNTQERLEYMVHVAKTKLMSRKENEKCASCGSSSQPFLVVHGITRRLCVTCARHSRENFHFRNIVL